MRSEIGVGIIGCGSVARWKYVKNLAEMSGVSLRAFYGGRAEEFQQQYGAPGSAVCRDLAEFLAREDVDAVCICTPNNSHAEIALAALRARKHVLCEKPMAISAEDAVRMVETAEQMGVLLTVGHQSRFSPAAQALYRQLREGAFGSLYFARASMVRRMGIPTWGHFFDPAVQGGGCLIDLGTHALDLALWLLNDFSPAYCCAGIFRGPGDSPTPANRWGTWDPAMLRTETGAFGQVVLQSGTVLSLDISWALHVPEDREETVTLCGTAAGAELFPGGYTISGTQGARLVTTRYQMPEEEQSAKLIRCGMGLVLGGVAALAVCFVFLLVASAAISGGLAGEELMYQLTIVGCVLGAFAGGLLAVRRCGSRALIVGLTTGGVLFLLLLTIGALCFETVSLEAGGIGLLCGSLCGGAAAGILGGGGKKKPARKKRRK